MEEKKDPTPLDELALSLEMAKKVEAEAKEARIEAEEKIFKLTGAMGEGSKTYNENYFKVVVKEPVNRPIDEGEYNVLKKTLRLGLKDPVKMKLSLDMKKFRDLEKSDPKTFKQFLKCITSKPGKIQVSVERRN